MKAFLYFLIIVATASTLTAQRSKSVLLPSDEAKKAAKQCSRPSPEEFSDTWVPSPEQIKKMEGRLSDISKLRVKSCCIIGAKIEDPQEWYLQYGALLWKGKKIIYINAVGRHEPSDLVSRIVNGDVVASETRLTWKMRAIVICDGGNAWGVLYEPATGKFFDLAINGIG